MLQHNRSFRLRHMTSVTRQRFVYAVQSGFRRYQRKAAQNQQQLLQQAANQVRKSTADHSISPIQAEPEDLRVLDARPEQEEIGIQTIFGIDARVMIQLDETAA